MRTRAGHNAFRGPKVVLIVATYPELARIWRRYIERLGPRVDVVTSQEEAVAYLADNPVDVIVLDLMLQEGSAIAVADYASYRRPGARVVFVNNSTFFSDGSIFDHIPNAAAVVRHRTPPNDLAAIVAYHGRAS